MGVYELSGAGSLKTPRTVYSSMNANNQYGAMVPIGTSFSTNTTAFLNIPQTFQDLRLVVSASIESGTNFPFVAINNEGSTASSSTRLFGNGSSALSERRTGDGVWFFGAIPFATGSTFVGSLTLDILNYASSTTFKTGISRWAHDLNGSGQTHLTAYLKQTTAPITRIDLGGNPGPFSVFTATLYGIRAVSS